MTQFVGAGTWVEKAAATTTVNLPLPAGAAAGDQAVMGFGCNSSTLVGTQSGVTTISDHASTTDTLAPSGWLGRKTLTSTDITNGFVTLGTVPSAVGSGQCIVFRDVLTTQDFTAAFLDKTGTADGNFAFVTQTLTQVGVVVVYFVSQATVAANSMTPPAGFTETGDRATGRNASMGYRIFGVPGATGTMTVVSGGTARGVGVMGGLRSRSVGGGFIPVLTP